MIDPKDIVLTVERYKSEKDWTLSEFYIKTVRRGYGVEDEFREIKVPGETRIPNGIYPLGLRQSPKFSEKFYMDAHGRLNEHKIGDFTQPHDLIWVMDVPNFQYVLWHWGNTDDDTDGCYIVGSGLADIVDKKKGGTQRGVGGSRMKYTEIYPEIRALILAAQAAGHKVYVEYKDKKAI